MGERGEETYFGGIDCLMPCVSVALPAVCIKAA